MAGAQARGRRVFFSLWPDDEVRERITAIAREWASRSQGVAIRPANFHVTLAFLGALSAPALDRARAVGAALHGAPFEFSLDTIESWAAAEVLCLTATQPEPTLLSLAARLRFSLLAQQVDSSPQEFRPHVSLARRPAARIDAPIGPVSWPVCEFVLVESVNSRSGSE